jgi:hypothetical protein
MESKLHAVNCLEEKRGGRMILNGPDIKGVKNSGVQNKT